MAEFVDEVPGAAARSTRSAGAINHDTVAEDYDPSTGRVTPSEAPARAKEIVEGEYGRRELPSSTAKLIDQMFVEDPPAADPPSDDPDERELEAAKQPPADPKADPATPTTPGATAPAQSAPPADWQVQLDRMTAANKQLVADLETARKPTEAPAVHKLAGEAVSTYLDNSTEAVRRFVAASLGIDDPAHADVTAEMQALTNDLTSSVFNVQLDPTAQATREAARARQALARDKRERMAESDRAAKGTQAQAEVQKAEHLASFIGNRLTASEYPATVALAPIFDGVQPGRAVYAALDTAIKAGSIDPKTMTDEQLIAFGAKEVEQHYKDLRDKVLKAFPPDPKPSTATNPPPESASPDQRQSHGARTLTQAAASVAPSTPPAVKAKTVQSRLPSKRDVLAKHIPD